MDGKYKNWLTLSRAIVVREYVRRKLRPIVTWDQASSYDPACSAIVGVCHRLPGVLVANLRSLIDSSWSSLNQVILVVDGPEGCLDQSVIERVYSLENLPDVQIIYYSDLQMKVAESLQLPYVYAWLSWCIGFSACRTRYALIHDYDALVFGDMLHQRYKQFVDSRCLVQGISWYEGNGIEKADKLATTFEAFVDVEWLRSKEPLDAFHKVRLRDQRSFDYDILLDLQHNTMSLDQRAIVPMSEESIVHPSQMIHQYTMFRRHPGKSLPCYSIPMIPFFEFLSGDDDALTYASQQLNTSNRGNIGLLRNDVTFNFSMLTLPQVDWALKQMVQACIRLQISPSRSLYEYGVSLYETIDSAKEEVWRGDFTSQQTDWINAACGAPAN